MLTRPLPAGVPRPREHPPASTHVSRWYGNVVAVNGISMTIGPGVTGLLGPNGAGKSTLIALMAGFLAPVGGHRHPRRRADVAQRQVYRTIGLVPERERCFGYLTGRQFVRRQRRAARPGRPGRRHRSAPSTWSRWPSPPDRRIGDVLQGHAAADQDRLRARPRPGGAAARRAVQRHRPAPADAPDGPAPHGWAPRAARCCSARTSSRRSSRSPARSRSSSPGGTPRPATSARSAG